MATVAIIISIVVIVGFAVGVILARSGDRPAKLSRPEKTELKELRALVLDLRQLAIEGAAVGETRSQVFLDRMRESENRINELP